MVKSWAALSCWAGIVGVVSACSAGGSISPSAGQAPATLTPSPVASVVAAPTSAKAVLTAPPPRDPQLRNSWPADWEREFQGRAQQVIADLADSKYGNTHGENEKRSYPNAMFDFLAGNRERAIAFLQQADQQAKDNQHTEGIDYYYAFTLKGQMRKYFLFGQFLDPDYKQQMFAGAKRWTEADPAGRSHPKYGKGNGSGNGWGPDVRGGWVDGRNTDNLRAMRETSVYLMAETTGNEAVRQKYKDKLQRYVTTLYQIGMGEWDSENYHGHTLAAYLNLYDFAEDPEVKQTAKAALDWLSAAAAVKYYRGGWGGPTKRDYGKSNVVFGSNAARLLWLYFGDAPLPNPDPERDAIHVITSSYRPPQAVVALARKQFRKPVELLITHPTYENWKPGKADQPAYWETTFFGETYQMGSVVSTFADGDVGPFKLMAQNVQRGVDYFVANTGGDRVTPGKHEGDQIAQYRNLLIWLRPADEPFFFQIPQTAATEVEDDIWFFQLENTWLALRPINLEPYSEVTLPEKWAEVYPQERTLKADAQGKTYAGFALEVGEPATHRTYEQFKRAVKRRGQLDLSAIAQGTVTLQSSTQESLQLTHNPDNEQPQIVRNGTPHNWQQHLNLYQPTNQDAPISLGWKQGRLKVTAGNHTFEQEVK